MPTKHLTIRCLNAPVFRVILHWRHRPFAGSVFLCVILSSAALAQNFSIDWHTIDGGGATNSTGGAFTISSTIGQPDAQSAPVMSGGTFEITGGFWPVANICYCLADMNHDGRKDGADIQRFVACVLGGWDCSCADVNQGDGVTIDDLLMFVTDLLAGPSCP